MLSNALTNVIYSIESEAGAGASPVTFTSKSRSFESSRKLSNRAHCSMFMLVASDNRTFF